MLLFEIIPCKSEYFSSHYIGIGMFTDLNIKVKSVGIFDIIRLISMCHLCHSVPFLGNFLLK